MRERVFIDTNILIYHFEKDETKYPVTKAIIANTETDLITSTQVIAEFGNVCLRKKFVENEDELELYIDEISLLFQITDFTVKDIVSAIRIRARYQLSFYDSLIITGALNTGCVILYSEDMQHGLLIEKKLKIINPFK